MRTLELVKKEELLALHEGGKPVYPSVRNYWKAKRGKQTAINRAGLLPS